jgi:superfamily I DNA/RNA helicase
MEKDAAFQNKYERAKAERNKHFKQIATSRANKKVVVAGPGTGKTYLFKEILRDKENSLTLTFVNALVEDLSLELNGLSNVRTLHSFARRLLGGLTKKDIRIFPTLTEVIAEDARTLTGEDIDFNQIFYNRDDENQHMKFYDKRRTYYDQCYGHSDVIFAVVKHLEQNRDNIPSYDQIVVDEFQDFNRLEVSLIDLLSQKSPVLLAGDDDQALYDFKNASPEHIRRRHTDKAMGYEPFNLPFCSRCTRVVVEATNDIIEAATRNGLLALRINKPFVYFDDQDKDIVSDRNPKIVYSQPYARQIPWVIGQRIKEVAKELQRTFSVLIISPTRAQSRQIATALKDKGFGIIEHIDRPGGKGPNLLDGLKLLLENELSNLGWRIACRFLLNAKDFESLLKETDTENPKAIHDLVHSGCKDQVKEMTAALKRLASDKAIDGTHLEILKNIGEDIYQITKDALAERLDLGRQDIGSPEIRKIPIRLTTIQSSKGLSAEYVFITHCDDQYLIRDRQKRISDQDICSFLVALTRARRKVFLLSSRKEQPTFVKWVNTGRIESKG